ncbi:hypothetical protein [Actinoplanes sp. NBRC 103695]|nr:hypothetical protein [Actinoplanes sp. NBRC 103695]
MPQSTVKMPVDAPLPGLTRTTFGTTFSIGTKSARLVAADASPLPPLDTK